MKGRGRSTDQALLRTAVNKKLQTFSHKRLQKDLEEIENQKIPTVGVTARPLESNLFIWHANIRGPQGTLYQGGVFHLQMIFPQSYPNHPPTVKLFNTIPHPNVFDGYICLDMIQRNNIAKREEGAGWSSAYSVQSILTQLQSFLFEENLSQDKAKTQVEIKKAVKEANSYKCTSCKHGGKLSCWPVFSIKEQNVEQFITIEGENDLIKEELICFHTKLTYLQNQLGFGLKISKIPRTGNIKEAQTYFDYISIKAFLKESINLTSANERITHWIPVYFGNGDNQERFFHFLKKALSMIMTNSTKNFNVDFILQVFPKLMINLIYYIMDEKKHPSIRIIRILTHVHSMFLYCIKQYPQLSKKITENLIKFTTTEEARLKENQGNLGSILAIMSVVDSHKFTDVGECYFQEQLDRQVLWILKAVPELLEESMVEEADKQRAKIVFKSQMTSYHIFCFFKLFLTEICERRKSKALFLEEYKANLCKLTNKEETFFQQKVKEIQKTVVSFDEFFKYTGLKPRNQEEVTKMLKEAIKNSERKKYHGDFELIHELPSSEEQFKKLMVNTPSYKKFIDIKIDKAQVGGKSEFKFDYKENISKDDDWRAMCIERWSWIKESMSYDSTLTSQNISQKAMEYAKQGISKAEDRLMKIINQKYKKSKIDYKEPKVNIPEIDWKRLFLRLDLEDFLTHIDMYPDFPSFYEKLFVCQKNNLNTILIPMIEIHNIKSGYYYLTALLTKLTTLKYIEFSGLPQLNNILNEKAAKAIKKGLTNFKEGKGKFDIISFYNITVQKDYSDCLFNYLTQTDSVTSLRFAKTNMFSYGNTMKVLCNALANMKDVQQIVLHNCSLNQQKCKILADSLMRMKKLRIFSIKDQTSLGQGLASIIYNLAFSPNLLMIDLGSTNIGGIATEITETVVSLQKLLKISASIQVLKINAIGGLNNYLSKDFWTALGECKSIRVLDVSLSGDLTAKVKEIGNAIAFNAKKKGTLQYFNMTGCLNGTASVNNLYWGMNISEYDEEQLYGDPNKVAKMIASNYKKQYFNNLKALQFDRCYNLNPNFVLSHHNKLVEKKDPEYVKLFSHSGNLETLLLQSTSLHKNIADILVLALDERRQGFKSRIKILDLSKNNLGKDGIKALAEVLPHNNVLEVLDLSKNNIGVSGASELAVSLKNNKSLRYLNVFNNKIGYDGAKAIAENVVAHHPKLEFLELGHNRIRDKGYISTIQALISNKNSNLRVLGLRFNFLSSESVLISLQKLTSHKTCLEQLFIRNNLIDDEGIYKLNAIHEEQKSKISIDLLQKVKYLDQDKSDRTIWIHPIVGMNLQHVKTFFEITYKCGIVIDIRVRNGRKYPNKNGENKFGFIEFADPMSVTKALHLAAKKLTNVDGVRFRIYKAGTGTFIYSKKTAKQKKLQAASSILPVLPFPNALDGRIGAPVAGFRGRGRGRGRGSRR